MTDDQRGSKIETTPRQAKAGKDYDIMETANWSDQHTEISATNLYSVTLNLDGKIVEKIMQGLCLRMYLGLSPELVIEYHRY